MKPFFASFLASLFAPFGVLAFVLTFLFVFAFVFATAAFARENPFKPSSSNTSVSKNNEESFEDFKSLDLTLPNSARIIKNIKITYQNVDGSNGEFSKDIQRKINWHEPIKITHQSADTNTSKDSYTDVFLKDPLVKVSYLGRYMRIVTHAQIINHFFLADPFRIVIDFKGYFEGTQERTIDNNYFKEAAVSSHDGFVRLTIRLDTYYSYIIETTTNGYILGLR